MHVTTPDEDESRAAGRENDTLKSPPAMAASYEADSGTLRVRAAPDVDPKDPFIAAIAGPGTETVEGFWIQRPWLLSPACPNVRETSPAEPAMPAGPTVAIAQFYGKSDSRVSQRANRAYELVREVKAGSAEARGPFDLVLTGRLRRSPRGKVIDCIAVSPDRPPRCIISAELGQVRIERVGTNDVLGEWGTG
jgi:hypothetical protein